LRTARPGVNFINIFMSIFYSRWSQKRKKIVNHQCHFALVGSGRIKADHKTLVKLTPVARKQWCCCEPDKILSQMSWNKEHYTSKDRLRWKKDSLECNYDCKSNYSYSQTWVNDLLRIATTCQQRPPFGGAILDF